MSRNIANKLFLDRSFSARFLRALEAHAHFSEHIRLYTVNRYLPLVEQADSDHIIAWLSFGLFTNIITIGSVLITSFLSLDKIVGIDNRNAFFWTTWCISLLVVVSNKLMSAYNVHDKYTFNNKASRRLQAEGWAFMQLAGKYANLETATAEKTFVSRVERTVLWNNQNITAMDAAKEHKDAGSGAGSVHSSYVTMTSTDIVPSPSGAFLNRTAAAMGVRSGGGAIRVQTSGAKGELTRTVSDLLPPGDYGTDDANA